MNLDPSSGAPAGDTGLQQWIESQKAGDGDSSIESRLFDPNVDSHPSDAGM